MRKVAKEPSTLPLPNYRVLLIDVKFSESFVNRKEGKSKREAIKSAAARLLLHAKSREIILGGIVEYNSSSRRVTVFTSPFGTQPEPTVKSVRRIVRNIMAENNVPPDNRPVIEKITVRPRFVVNLG